MHYLEIFIVAHILQIRDSTMTHILQIRDSAAVTTVQKKFTSRQQYKINYESTRVINQSNPLVSLDTPKNSLANDDYPLFSSFVKNSGREKFD